MSFYTSSKTERVLIVAKIRADLLKDVISGKKTRIRRHFGDEDTYIRKAAYLSIGRIYKEENQLRNQILKLLNDLADQEDFKIRQTVINAAGEIGKTDFKSVQKFFDTGLFDRHHAPRNAVIGSIKKMGEVNPKPVLKWAKKYLQHPDKEIRREICHGIELRGRKYPEDILPLLQELQFDKTARVRNTLVHVIGQIAYKKDCLTKVVEHLKGWENKSLVDDALEEIIDVHDRYKNFAILSQKQAIDFIHRNFR